ncbi:MAG: HIT domain-containing protein [Desulfotalea sp.]
MKTIWTPWRMDHVLGKEPKVEGCLFEPKTNSTNDKDSLLLLQNIDVVILLNRFPYANGHLLVAPTRHVACITELTKSENHHLMEMVRKSSSIIKKVFKPHGLNIGCNIGACAGAGIADHLHFHIIPRWHDDHNFMTTISEVRTIPQHIEDSFDLLLKEFKKLNK